MIRLPRTTERPGRESGDECSEVHRREAPQSNGRKSVVRGLHLPFFLALFFLVVPKESVGQNGKFTDLDEVTIVVEKLDSESKNLGLDEMAIKNHVLVLLRTKLPRLLVEDSALSRVHITVDVGEIRTGSKILAYYGSVSIGVTRRVTIMKTGEVTLASLYNSTIRLTGPPSETSENVRGVLDELLTGFAAAWNQDNPSK